MNRSPNQLRTIIRRVDELVEMALSAIAFYTLELQTEKFMISFHQTHPPNKTTK